MNHAPPTKPPRSRRWLRRLAKAAAIVMAILVIRLGLGIALQPEPPRPPVDDPDWARALALHEQAIVVDGHNDVPTWITDFGFDLGMHGDEPSDGLPILHFVWPSLPGRPGGEEVKTQTDLDRIRSGGLDAQFFSIWVACAYLDPDQPGAAIKRAHAVIDALEASVARHPNRVQLASSVAELEHAVGDGKLAALMGLEGGHAIEDDLDALRRLFGRGIRYMTLTHTCSHSWADASTDEPRHGGLTEFGRAVVREMNRLGMIVDVSHVSDDTFWDVIAVTNVPVMASHSSAWSVAQHPRNMKDDMLRAVAKNGGVVMVNFLANYLDPRKTNDLALLSGWYWLTHPGSTATPLTIVVDHIDHIVSVAGIDHVGLGSDFDGGPFFPDGLDGPADLPKITVELVRRGYSDDDIRKILGGNALRVWRAVERAAG